MTWTAVGILAVGILLGGLACGAAYAGMVIVFNRAKALARKDEERRRRAAEAARDLGARMSTKGGQ